MKHVVLFVLLSSASPRSGCLGYQLTDDNICRTPEGRFGVCVKIRECSHIIQFIINTKEVNTNVKEFLKSYTCGYDENKDDKVCCPPTPIEPSAIHKRKLLNEKIKLLPTDSCGVIPDTDKIINGRNAQLFELPWMALLLYNEPSTACGGTLISKRYVLTAAHCIDPEPIKLVKVRLGEFDISTEPDCDNFTKKCAKPTQNFDVTTKDAIVHPNYNKSTFANDLALIRLKTEADTSADSVASICLPLGVIFNTKKKYIAAGWGITETGFVSNILKKARLTIRSQDVCMMAYNSYTSYMHHENHLCTTGGRKEQSSCVGDSGGPLMVKVRDGRTLRMIQYGVVSFGVTFCQFRSHHGFPSVFTNLSPYVDWILESIQP